MKKIKICDADPAGTTGLGAMYALVPDSFELPSGPPSTADVKEDTTLEESLRNADEKFGNIIFLPTGKTIDGKKEYVMAKWNGTEFVEPTQEEIEEYRKNSQGKV